MFTGGVKLIVMITHPFTDRRGVILLSASRISGVSTAVPESNNFQDSIFYDESDLSAERHLFPEIISDSFCTWTIISAHLSSPLFSFYYTY